MANYQMVINSMNKRSIYLIHIFSIIILSSGLMVHVLILPSLLSAGKRDSWISVLLSVPPLFLWNFLSYYIYKKLGNQDPIQFIRTHLGKKLSSMLGYLLSLYFMESAFVTLNYTANWSLTHKKTGRSRETNRFLSIYPLLNRNRLRQVTWLIYITIAVQSSIVRN
ncbi:GerAB/ArcD/ProY family transporter [Rossellomorea aquimaris]|uniref:GerAB/ArcD/ProY family transporter n=1 Tax=Rossellomorea aquimaris TaxID=189382 RepID=UPI003CEB71CD